MPKQTHTHTHTHTVHMALVGYLIVFSFVTKCGQTIEFLLWGTNCSIEFPCGVPLFYCCKYPTTYGVTHTGVAYVRAARIHEPVSGLLVPLNEGALQFVPSYG